METSAFASPFIEERRFLNAIMNCTRSLSARLTGRCSTLVKRVGTSRTVRAMVWRLHTGAQTKRRQLRGLSVQSLASLHLASLQLSTAKINRNLRQGSVLAFRDVEWWRDKQPGFQKQRKPKA